MMIYPLIRKEGRREDCIRRTNHWSNRVIEEIRNIMVRSTIEAVNKWKLKR
jgi:hypothetical protein